MLFYFGFQQYTAVISAVPVHQGAEFLGHAVCVVIVSKYAVFSQWLEIVGSFCFVTPARVPWGWEGTQELQ